MKLISCQNGRILTSLKSEEAFVARQDVVVTGLDALDRVAPDGGFARGAIHEVLSDPQDSAARTFAFMLAGCMTHEDMKQEQTARDSRAPLHVSGFMSSRTKGGAIVFCDDDSDLYPPAIASSGIPLDHLYLLRPSNRQDRIWTITECLRCKGVAATIASIDHLSRLEARRLQLAAEHGGGMGLLLRPMIRSRAGLQAPSIYAAATRWLVAPEIGEPTVQRWKIQLIHGHGGRVGETVILEHSRETNLVRAVEKLADRPMETLVRTVG